MQREKTFYKFGVITLIISALLLLSAQLIIIHFGKIPVEQNMSLQWVQKNSWSLAILAEIMVFGAALWTPSGILTYTYFKEKNRGMALIWSSLISTTVLGMFIAALFTGRIAYKVYDIPMNHETFLASLSIIVNAIHMISLAQMFMLLVITIFIFIEKNPFEAIITAMVGAMQFVMAFPWVMPKWLLIISVSSLFAWFV